ncbi:MAG: response regulator transcription factor [Candidatus Sulfotelmatobacter sp.]
MLLFRPPVGLIEQNPLAVPYLQHLLREKHIIVRFDSGLLTRLNVPRKPVAVFVIDVGTLLVSLATCLQQVRHLFPASKILLIGHKPSRHQMLLLTREGIQGFVSYAEVRTKIVRAIRAVLDGKVWFQSETLEQSGASTERTPRLRRESVTKRERRIIHLLEQRLSNKQAAEALNISENTIKFHLSNIFRKLDVHDRQSAVVAYISGGLGGRIDAATNRTDPLRLPGQARRPCGSQARSA